jgi:LacI family transcriptional regulator
MPVLLRARIEPEMIADVSEERSRSARATLEQVALLAGVSVKTASRALNGERYVAASTQLRVRAAAEQLGFRLNAFARDFRTGARSRSVGLLIGDLANPFYARLARGAERRLQMANLRLVSASTEEDPARERELVDEMLERRLSAILIVTSAATHPYVEAERRLGTPIVFVDRVPTDVLADTVVLDNVGGTTAAVKHLLELGHERIGILSNNARVSTSRERVEAFEAAMLIAGLDPHRFSRTDRGDTASAEKAIRDLMSMPTPPTAVITTNNRLTVGALRAVAAGRPRPALVGFDDFDLADLLEISVIAHDPEAMGAAAASIAIDRLNGDDTPPRWVVMPTQLVERASSTAAREGTSYSLY